MGQKKSNKKNKKSVADLILKHHFDDKVQDADDAVVEETQSEETQEIKVNIGVELNSETENIKEEKVFEKEFSSEELPADEMDEIQDNDIISSEENSAVYIDMENLDVETKDKQSNKKTEIKDFLETSDEILNSVEKKKQIDSDEAVKQLQDFLNKVDKRVDRLAKAQAEKDDEFDIVGDEFQFKKLKNELTFFQNELEKSINGQFGDLSEAVMSVILDLKNKISEIQEYLEQDTTKQLRIAINGVKSVKSEVDSVSDEVNAIDKQAIFETEKRTKQIIGLTKKFKDELLAEIKNLQNITARADVIDAYNDENKLLFDKTNKQNVELFNKTNAENVALFETRSAENISTVKNELAQVRNNLHSQIQEILRKIVIQEEIKSLCEDALGEIRNNNGEISVVRKFMKGTQAVEQRQEELLDEIRVLVEDLSDYELNEASDKVDIIYENIGMLNEWVNKSDKLIADFDVLREDFDINSDKVDIIYDNLTFINDWVKKLDKFAKDIEDLKTDFERDEKLTEKIDSLYTNINAIKDWSKKADALALQVRALSVQISETESTINSQNLADIKELFTQMTEDMSNLSSRTNKMILDTDKTNDTMVGHLNNLKTMIDLLRDTTDTFEFAELNNKIEDIKHNFKKSTDFETVMTEAFGYLAEWIDAAGVTINQIRTDLNNVQSQQDEQVEQINKQYNEQVDRLAEIKNSFESISKIEEQTENNVAEQIADIISQNNIAVQDVVTKQNQEIQDILAAQSVQIQKIIEEQQLHVKEIQNLQSQSTQLLEGFMQYQLQNGQLLQSFQQLQEQSSVAIDKISEQSDKIVRNVQDLQSDISGEIHNLQPQNTSIVERSTDEEIIEKLAAIAEYIEQKDDSQQIVESIEEKITALKPDNSEIKNLLDFIASQVVSANENSIKTELLSKKIDSMETKLSSLEQYMARLIEYLDEDE